MNVAIVVAAGKGTRLGGNRPKQFLELDGIPVIIHTLKQFERCREISELVIVLPQDETDGFLSLLKEFGLQKPMRIVAGGPTRAQSVQRGLAVISEAEIVAVHDGVRPFVTPAEIDQVVTATRLTGAAILVAPVADTIKEIKDDRIVRTLSRSQLRGALTPQCFRFDILQRAYEQLAGLEAEGIEVTDDCFLVERLGLEIVAVEGSARNIKITREEDLVLGEALLRSFVL
ncbi:MAG: 2-C-methyl-D-erythritol 4-phosphate cytidylyltransferase [Blastocatellia bacterium]|jgi:2-C-methyl-D-erythritol 4-phosphate cytidylyltransferase|nr:2-C-methyl-D-erythritol 4-phosphate cytidylyltransferase [Blastocatellia bacterium]